LLNQIAAIHGTGVAAVTNSYESIQTVTVGTPQSSIDFTSIPSTFKHLQVRYIARTSRSAEAEDLILQLNSDTGSNYSFHFLLGTGTNPPAAGAGANQTFIYVPTATASTAAANNFGAGVVDILDYGNTNKYKTVRNLGGEERNGNGTIAFESGAWLNTNAVSTVTFKTVSANNFATNSSFALYGIKG